MVVNKDKITIDLLRDKSSIILCDDTCVEISVVNEHIAKIYYFNFNNKKHIFNYSTENYFMDKSKIKNFNKYIIDKLIALIKSNDVLIIRTVCFAPDFIQDILKEMSNYVVLKQFFVLINLDFKTLRKYYFSSNFEIVNSNYVNITEISDTKKKTFLNKFN
jgi:hypothetical protein